MQDPLLYRPIHRIPVVVIKKKVSEATDIPLSLMLMSNKIPTARKREYVSARQISMTLSMKYSHESLAYVGKEHGGRNHATVLYAIATINNLIYTKNETITGWFTKSCQAIKEWDINNNSKYNKLIGKEKCKLVKYWIRNRVPLFIRARQLKYYGQYCKYCGQLINKTVYS